MTVITHVKHPLDVNSPRVTGLSPDLKYLAASEIGNLLRRTGLTP